MAKKKSLEAKMSEIENKKVSYIEKETEGYTIRKDKGKLVDDFWDKNPDLWNEWQDLDSAKLNLYTEDALYNYKRLAGEVEARETQKRKDLTAEERKALRPYKSGIPREDVIVKFGEAGLQSSTKAEPKTTADRAFDIVLSNIQGMTNFPTVRVVQSVENLPKRLKGNVTAFYQKEQ